MYNLSQLLDQTLVAKFRWFIGNLNPRTSDLKTDTLPSISRSENTGVQISYDVSECCNYKFDEAAGLGYT